MNEILITGGRRCGRTRRLKIMSVLNPAMRLMTLPKLPSLLNTPRAPNGLFDDDSWVKKLFFSQTRTEMLMTNKFVWFDDDGYHEKSVDIWK